MMGAREGSRIGCQKRSGKPERKDQRHTKLPCPSSAPLLQETVLNSRAVALNRLFVSRCFENLMETTGLHQSAPYRVTHHFPKPCSWIAGKGITGLGVQIIEVKATYFNN